MRSLLGSYVSLWVCCIGLPAYAEGLQDWPERLAGKWVTNAAICTDPQYSGGFELTFPPADQENVELTFLDRATEGGVCRPGTLRPKGDAATLKTACQHEEGEFQSVTFDISMSSSSEAMILESAFYFGESFNKILLKCPEEEFLGDLAQLVLLLTNTIDSASELKDVCSSTFQASKLVTNDRRFYNIVACESSLQYSFEFASLYLI